MKTWTRVMAVGCSHGDLVNPEIRKQVIEFRDRFRPEIRFELGDMTDTACFRSGSAGTKDESRSSRDDVKAAHSWLDEYEPTHIAWGNHDWRVYELSTHPKAIVRDLASDIWEGLKGKAEALKAKTVPYDIKHGWHYLGGRAWGHGYMYNLSAVRDHAEMVGLPVVMAHLHAPQMVEGRTIKDTPSFCVGAMADDENLTYGRRRRNSLTHGHGIVYGEVSGEESHLWLIRSENGKPLHFPPGL
jgi:hypothetical protein